MSVNFDDLVTSGLLFCAGLLTWTVGVTSDLPSLVSLGFYIGSPSLCMGAEWLTLIARFPL